MGRRLLVLLVVALVGCGEGPTAVESCRDTIPWAYYPDGSIAVEIIVDCAVID